MKPSACIFPVMCATFAMAALKFMPSDRRKNWRACARSSNAARAALWSSMLSKSPPNSIHSSRRNSASRTISRAGIGTDSVAQAILLSCLLWMFAGVRKRESVGMEDLKKLIREVKDYPKPGILFYDLTTLLKDKQGFHTLIDRLCGHFRDHEIDIVAGIEARGFIFAPALAYRLGAGFVPVRK